MADTNAPDTDYSPPSSNSPAGTQWMQILVPCTGYESVIRLGQTDLGASNSQSGTTYSKPNGISLNTNGFYFSSTTGVHQQLAGGTMSAYGMTGLNLSSQGGVAISSLSTETTKNLPDPETNPGVFPQVNSDGTLSATKTIHDQFVNARNSVFDDIEDAKEWAQVISATIMVIKAVLGTAIPATGFEKVFEALNASAAFLNLGTAITSKAKNLSEISGKAGVSSLTYAGATDDSGNVIGGGGTGDASPAAASDSDEDKDSVWDSVHETLEGYLKYAEALDRSGKLGETFGQIAEEMEAFNKRAERLYGLGSRMNEAQSELKKAQELPDSDPTKKAKIAEAQASLTALESRTQLEQSTNAQLDQANAANKAAQASLDKATQERESAFNAITDTRDKTDAEVLMDPKASATAKQAAIDSLNLDGSTKARDFLKKYKEQQEATENAEHAEANARTAQARVDVLAGKESGVDEATKDVTEADGELTKANAEVTKANTELEDANKEVKEAQDKVTAATTPAEKAAAEQKLREAQAKAAKAQTAADDAKTEADKAQKESNAKHSAKELAEEREALRKRTGAHSQSLEDATEEHAKAQKEYSEALEKQKGAPNAADLADARTKLKAAQANLDDARIGSVGEEREESSESGTKAMKGVGFGGAVFGAATATAGLISAVTAKESTSEAPSGISLISDNSVVVATKKDFTTVAEGGVNIVVPGLSSFNATCGGGVIMQSALYSEFSSLQAVTLEGGLTASMVAGGEATVASRCGEAKLIGTHVSIGQVEADGVITQKVSLPDCIPSINPFAQKPTIGVSVAALTEINLEVGPASVMITPGAITLRCGESSIVISEAGISITSPDISIKGATAITGATDITGDVAVEGATSLTGDLNIIGEATATGLFSHLP